MSSTAPKQAPGKAQAKPQTHARTESETQSQAPLSPETFATGKFAFVKTRPRKFWGRGAGGEGASLTLSRSSSLTRSIPFSFPCPQLNRPNNPFQHNNRIAQHVIPRNSQNLVAMTLQVRITSSIVFFTLVRQVMLSIDLDYQLQFHAAKVDRIRFNRNLTSKFPPATVSIANHLPNIPGKLIRGCPLIASKLGRFGVSLSWLFFRQSDSPSHPTPLPQTSSAVVKQYSTVQADRDSTSNAPRRAFPGERGASLGWLPPGASA